MRAELVGYVGPGHARHALTAGEALCGAVAAVAKRTGRRPQVNNTSRFERAKVTCARCRRALDAMPYRRGPLVMRMGER